MNPSPLVSDLFIGQPKTITDERGTWTSSIFRDRAAGAVRLEIEGLVGDKVAQPYHGSPDAAVCVYVQENYRFWNANEGMDLLPGSFGENFTLDGIAEEEICIGDTVQVGTALLQVSCPRVPCANLARRIGRADWVKRVIRENRTGFYLRVLEPGMVQAGDAWSLRERPNPDGQITALNRCLYLEFDPVFAERLIGMAGMADLWKEQIRKKREKPADHWTATMAD